ncbi:oxygen-dependent protoporphyrinogen oxidase [Actinomycetospora succinea]|uniref:Coproporphyrinogen III oxidase n=1 Tax=Actinomycetospora succinea TaxID=663603 RepID=A0A4R6VPC7_9PSEU|nr:protoporphyrinogen oxidase [Actinomycetospora succinea]TDQ65883.1 oxygen-dependent protoporphyrinogen oxidase [Actinomycetospora succinea]
MTRVLVVGGGVSGLAAAHRLRTLLGPDAELVVVEAARTLGGKLSALEIGGRRVDVGAEAFLARRPEAAERIAELGLGDQLVHPGRAASSLQVGGRRTALPPRTMMGVPGDPDVAADALSPAGLAALREDRPGPWEPGGDVAVGALVRERLGDEVADRLVDPLLGGVYAGHADGLGLRATVPALAAALDADPRSLLAAARSCLPAPPVEGAPPLPVFGTLRGSLADLPATLALAARAELRLGRTVTALSRTPTGWRAELGENEPIDADAVVLAVPAPALRRLLADHAPDAARAAGEVELASTALVVLALPAAAAAPLAGRSGVLVGAGERRPDGLPWTIKAATFSSEKWPHLAVSDPARPDPDDTAVLRLSIGRHGDAASLAALRRDDDDLVSAARSDLAALTGIEEVPVESAVVRWPGGLPQYGVGHVERVAALEAGVAALPGLAVAGATLHGVGVPACLATADAAARRVADHLARSAQPRA